MLLLKEISKLMGELERDSVAQNKNDNNINEIVDNLDLFDDDLMSLVFKKNIPATELVLSIILGRKITVISVYTQDEMRSPEIGGRDVTLDVHAIDCDGTEFDVEVQGSSEGAHVRRTRFHSAVMDSRMLKEGDPFKILKDSYVIFFYKHDKFGKGLPMYHVERVVLETGKTFNDGSHIIYVNGNYKGDDEIGKLIEDFHSKNANNMHFQLLADGLRHYKETEKGREIVSEKVERYAKEYAKEHVKEYAIDYAKEYAKEHAKEYAEESRIGALAKSVDMLMKNTSVTLEQAFANLGISDDDKVVISKLLQEHQL